MFGIGIDYKKTLFTSSAASLAESSPKEYAQVRSDCHLRSAKRLLKLCEDNGGCFIKVGQHIAALDYLLPDEYVHTMRVLRAKAPEMPLDDVITVLKEDLQKEVC